ncbi:MAG: hypothetical protein AB1349_02015 [Elusimicrobiota bacterium]
MNNRIAQNQKDVEKYRKSLFKSKEKCRQLFAREPFEKKLKTAFELYRQAQYLKKFKPSL